MCILKFNVGIIKGSVSKPEMINKYNTKYSFHKEVSDILMYYNYKNFRVINVIAVKKFMNDHKN